MRARLFLLLILLLTTTSFFWEDEEKQLRQLHQSGEAAMLKKEYETAKKAFEELLGRISVVPSPKYQVNWNTYVDVAMRLAQVYDELHEKEEAEKVLALVLAKKPPEALTRQVKLMKAQLAATRASPAEAYFEMNMLSQQFPFEKWSAKELTFYHALEQSLDIYYDELVRKAKLYLTAGIYPEAISLYEEILTAIERNCYPKVKSRDALLAKTVCYRLAECHYLNANYEKSLSYLLTGNVDAVDREMIYLSALCYREKKEYEKALELFQNYTHLGDSCDLDHYDHALYEIGHYFYQTGQLAKARLYFERLQQFNRKPSQLAALLLARIYIEEGEPKEVEKLLAPLTDLLSTQDPLQYECYYLRGLAAYELAAYSEARDFFERSLPCKKVGKWSSHSIYHLGWCYARLGDDPLKAEQVRRSFFNMAEESFTSLLDSQQDEEACLSLAQLHVLAFRHFQQQESVEKLETLLQAKAEAFSLQGQIETLLLRAEVAPMYADKEHLYGLATADKFRKTPLYAQAWYCRGLNHFMQGLQDTCFPTPYFEVAASAFEKAFHRIEKSDRHLAADILKMEAKANMCQHSPITSLALLEKLLVQFEERVEEREETLYLRGLLASQLPSLSYFPVAEESLNQVIQYYPHGKYRMEAIYALATLYYNNGHYEKAQKAFCRLATEFPQSSQAPDAWFWAAEAAALAGDNPIPLRRHVYEEYPSCPQAAEAYFRQYSYARYIEGGAEAIHHLKDFSSWFKDSPLEIVVYYLLGSHEEKLENARAAFDQALASFSRYQKSCQSPDSAYIYFYYHTMLELADRYLKEPIQNASLEECERVLCSLVADFEQPEHALASLLKHKSPYPTPFEEGEFKLVQCYLKQGKESSAQKKLHEMLQHYDGAGIRDGYYLSQVWLEQGRLAMRCEDYDTALNCFDIALSCTPSDQGDEHQLTLWLQQSACYREKKEYDLAMRLLSKVINAETASPLRLKAMYLRSEIYELEGRPELAIRQLEATAKKGGEWAQQAKETLRRHYGYE